MTLRDDLNACTPRLRRYARALTTGCPGGSAFADDLVHTALMRALGARQLGPAGDLSVRLFATVTQLFREAAGAGRQAQAAGSGRPALVAEPFAPTLARQSRLSAGLMSLAIEDREALLLVALEGFDHADAARILRISRGTLLGRLTRARQTLDMHLKSQPRQPTPRTRTAPHLRLVT